MDWNNYYSTYETHPAQRFKVILEQRCLLLVLLKGVWCEDEYTIRTATMALVPSEEQRVAHKGAVLSAIQYKTHLLFLDPEKVD